MDYSKVFASGATSQQEWSDDKYVKGWGSNGSIPPSVEQFDALQRNTDLKLKDLDDRVTAAGEGGITEVNDNTIPTVDRDTIGNIIDALAHQVKSLSGKNDWKAEPSTSLNNINIKAIASLMGQTGGIPVFASSSAFELLVLSTLGRSLLTIDDVDVVRTMLHAAGTSAATQSANGLMSATDKAKLDRIADNANNYSLPAATGSVRGGVTVGSNINLSGDKISITSGNVTNALGYTPPRQDTTYGVVNSSNNGLMTPAMLTKLNNAADLLRALTGNKTPVFTQIMNNNSSSFMDKVNNTTTGISGWGTATSIDLTQSYKNFDKILVIGANDRSDLNVHELWDVWELQYMFDTSYRFSIFRSQWAKWVVYGNTRHGTKNDYTLSTDTKWVKSEEDSIICAVYGIKF